MFRRLVNTPNDIAFTVLRLVLGIVFFAHGAQKMLGWFGGYGFHGTMGFFTGMGVPAALAFLAICAEFFASRWRKRVTVSSPSQTGHLLRVAFMVYGS